MLLTNSTRDNIKGVTLKLLDYCRANDWAGYDPYDALNSKMFKASPFLNFRLFRLALTQVFKRSPINLRRLFLVPKTQNPKALALFLMAFLKLERAGLLEDKSLIPLMVQKLIDHRSRSTLSTVSGQLSTDDDQRESVNRQPSTENSYWCWGYSFPWQTRTILVPRDFPNIVCTTFVANALLDLYEKSGEQEYLNMAHSASEYILEELYWEKGPSAGFSYPIPKLDNTVHNANFLGSAFLCRVYKMTGEKKLLDTALKTAQYSVSKQREDGSWDYGEAGTQAWVDNFHTGYNLCALKDIGDYGGTREFDSNIKKGFEFYVNNFFREDGAPKYFHNHNYPIDIHSVAQSIITLLEFNYLDQSSTNLAHRVFEWAVANMWDKRGHFYYQVTPYYKNKVSYMRWSQAWMLLALTILPTHVDQIEKS